MAKTKTKTIRVLVFPVGAAPTVKEIDGGLASFQALVGGYIECVSLGDVDLFCNEEGKLSGLPLNFRKTQPIPGDIIAGDFFLVRCGEEGEAKSVTDTDIEKYSWRFSLA